MNTTNSITGTKIVSISSQIRVEKLECREFSGDWHDAPMRWKVCGPANEVQKFARKKDAITYKVLRASCKTDLEAIHCYARRVD